jgi:serine/threonine-protein kinase
MSDRDAAVGTEVAGYRIDSFVGRGGMSVVYLATSRDGRRVALKLLASQLSENEKFRDRFGRESRVAASLGHPNVVPVFEAGEAGGTLFIAMRYIEGTDLARLVRAEGPLSVERTLSIVEQVAAGLDAAHEAGLVHRDVKPGNILVEPGGEPGTDHAYLSDFGLTKRALSVSGFTATGELVGTVDYVAPEQIRGDALDSRADVYSLGAVLVECLTGHVPFQRDAEVATLWATRYSAIMKGPLATFGTFSNRFGLSSSSKMCLGRM